MKKLLYAIIALAAVAAYAQQQFSPAHKLQYAEHAIAKLYVDSVDEEKLVEDAIVGMLKNLDPHSSYSNAKETQELNEPLEGSFSGIGISFNMATDTLYVIETIGGGPSERVGILPGDRILKVNDTVIAGVKMLNSDIMRRLRGPKGTTVDVQVLRLESGRPDTIDFRIERDDIPIFSVDAAYMVEPGIGYIRLNKFGGETHKEFAEAAARLKKEGMKDLILDLSDNGGGYLKASVDIVGELLPSGSLAVFTEGNNNPRYDYFSFPSQKKPLLEDGRLVVMINQFSASASEITAGAVQDWDRGVLVGRRSYGKGLVQRPVPFPDGSMIRLTVSHYYTPTGRDIQKPYTKGNSDAYAHDIIDRLNRGELMHADSIKYVDSLKVKTLRLNRPIYGGGGISPDVFVGIDTTENTKYYRQVMAKGLINRFAIKTVDRDRREILKTYPTDADFVKEYTITDAQLNELFEMAGAEKIEFNKEEAELSTPLFRMVLKGLIGRDIYDSSTYFKVYNERDPMFIKALEIIKSRQYDDILKAPK
ncbi:MAG: S41 family peptidase [Muribaculaceae bacterium]|nr:S41 family peptidase [Muribaculaceae bacterium]